MVSTAKRVEKPRIGIFGIGLAAYWPQFASLQGRLTGYLHLIEERLGQWGEVVSGGLVDTDEAARAAAGVAQAQAVPWQAWLWRLSRVQSQCGSRVDPGRDAAGRRKAEVPRGRRGKYSWADLPHRQYQQPHSFPARSGHVCHALERRGADPPLRVGGRGSGGDAAQGGAPA